ncbi:DNA cytosine methyltransferase [Bacillus toyonensis]|nr:DNA (cytosine-5-)-methyltransferase [Bacillus toyonensis]
MSLTFIDLFAGIGGFRLGMEQAGHKCLGYVEWDKFARKSYEAIHNTEGEWTAHDINSISPGEIPGADVWTLGFPCTDISKAKNNRKGIDGESSSTFFTVTNLLKGKSIKPRYLFIENVSDLLKTNGGWDFARLIIELGEIGYSCTWKVINSEGYVAQNRERVFIIASYGEGCGSEVFPPSRKSNTALKRVATFDIKAQDSLKRIYSVDGLCPTLTTMQGGHRQPKVLLPNGEARKLTPRECWRLQGFPDSAFNKAQEVNSNSQLYKQSGNSVTVPVIYEIAKRLV